MKKPDLTNWQEFPKTELHIHLEGAAPTDFIRTQSNKYGIDLANFVEGDRYLWRDFNDFLKTYEAVMSVLKTPEDFDELTRAVLNAQADHGVFYTEITLGVVLMCENDPVRWKEMLSAINEAADYVEKSRGIIARFTAVIVRHFGVDCAEKTANVVANNLMERVSGFGMAGAEDYGLPVDFSRAYSHAREAGLGLTVHAGEWCGPTQIEQSIKELGVTRLGHGVRSVESSETLALIKDRDIHLEVNPGSNVALGASGSWAVHQIHRLKEEGISFSISTDDPPYFETTMTREYQELSELGWDKAHFHKSNLEALRHAFVDDATRTNLIQTLENKIC